MLKWIGENNLKVKVSEDKILSIELIYGSTIPLPVIYLKKDKTYINKNLVHEC